MSFQGVIYLHDGFSTSSDCALLAGWRLQALSGILTGAPPGSKRQLRRRGSI